MSRGCWRGRILGVSGSGFVESWFRFDVDYFSFFLSEKSLSSTPYLFLQLPPLLSFLCLLLSSYSFFFSRVKLTRIKHIDSITAEIKRICNALTANRSIGNLHTCMLHLLSHNTRRPLIIIQRGKNRHSPPIPPLPNSYQKKVDLQKLESLTSVSEASPRCGEAIPLTRQMGHHSTQDQIISVQDLLHSENFP